MARIYTRSGDDGTTGLIGGRRVSKGSTRVWACGAVDELNAVIGQARAFNKEPGLNRRLRQIQNDLFDLGAELASPAGKPRIRQAHVRRLEKLIDQLDAKLPPLKKFILPAGSETAAALHVARTACRRAERFCVNLAAEEPVGQFVIPYLNRLGDALFVLARYANRQANVRESVWNKRR
jgi:cob(I)alamin adenosyltransferase